MMEKLQMNNIKLFWIKDNLNIKNIFQITNKIVFLLGYNWFYIVKKNEINEINV